MDCDRLAPWYRWLEYAAFGGLLQARRLAFLPAMSGATRALVLGDGDGRFLATFVKSNRQVEIDCVDCSGRMLALARERLWRADPAAAARVHFSQTEALVWRPSAGLTPVRYDLVVTHFFLDCFATAEVAALAERVAEMATVDALWVVSDFRQPARGPAAWLARLCLAGMYRFFGLVTGLTVRRLPDHAGALRRAGFRLERQFITCFGLLTSQLWRARAAHAAATLRLTPPAGRTYIPALSKCQIPWRCGWLAFAGIIPRAGAPNGGPAAMPAKALLSMDDQLAYVLVTPHSMRKSRTGPILSRLLSRSGLELVGGRMFAPGRELTEAYAATAITDDPNPRHRVTQELIRDYIRRHLGPDEHGRHSRCLLLVFRGKDAVGRIMTAVGHIVHERTSAETIRDTYGDYVVAEDGTVSYFEPAVLAAPTPAAVASGLKLWARYSDSDGGLLDEVIPFPVGTPVEKTLVLIKPDNFLFPNTRPGGVIDLFSRTGLSMIGFKILWMSVAQAMEFYGPVLAVLEDKLKEPTGKRARLAVESELGVPISGETERQLGELLGPIKGRSNWEDIIDFMSGKRPAQCADETERQAPGTKMCVAIIYQGPDAVSKIRDVLGPTDPTKAPPGSIRREYGSNIMVNAAHASDSADNARREQGIIRMEENNFRTLIAQAYRD